MEEKARVEESLLESEPPDVSGGSSLPVSASRLKRRLREATPYIGAVLVVLFTLVQFLGVLLRDRMEGRIPAVSAEVLLAAVEKAAPSHGVHEGGNGVGFGVVEIPVGPPPGEVSQPSAEHGGPLSPEKGKVGVPALPSGAGVGKSSPQEGKSEPQAGKPGEAQAHGSPVPGEKPAIPTAHGDAAPKVVKAKPLEPAMAESKPPQAQEKANAGKAAEKKAAQVKDAAPAHEASPAPVKQAVPNASAKLVMPTEEGTVKTPEGAARALRFKPDAMGGYAVAVGAFNSQRLAVLLEKKLDDLGFPHLRTVVLKDAEGFTLTVDAASEAVVEKAAEALAGSGYKADKAGTSLALRFLSREEAEKALAVAEKAGAEGTVAKAVGQISLLRVLVGPTTAENARKAQGVLKTEGIDCVVVRYKP